MSKIADSMQVLERNGGDDGTRTRGLCRARAASLESERRQIFFETAA